MAKHVTLKMGVEELRLVRFLILRMVGREVPKEHAAALNMVDAKVLDGLKQLETEFVPFGDVARKQCGDQSQYVSRYVDGRIAGYPVLGEGLRFRGEPSNYHGLEIHRDDVAEFVRRYKAYRQSAGLS